MLAAPSKGSFQFAYLVAVLRCHLKQNLNTYQSAFIPSFQLIFLHSDGSGRQRFGQAGTDNQDSPRLDLFDRQSIWRAVQVDGIGWHSTSYFAKISWPVQAVERRPGSICGRAPVTLDDRVSDGIMMFGGIRSVSALCADARVRVFTQLGWRSR